MFVFKKIFAVLMVAGFLLTACGGQRSSAPVEVQITLTEFTIVSSLTDFEVGVPYHFVVTNAGTVEHEFMIMPPLAKADMGMGMGSLDDKALAMIAGSDLPAGATASFDYTFTETASAGTLEFACHTPGHYEANMKLPINVQ